MAIAEGIKQGPSNPYIPVDEQTQKPKEYSLLYKYQSKCLTKKMIKQ